MPVHSSQPAMVHIQLCGCSETPGCQALPANAKALRPSPGMKGCPGVPPQLTCGGSIPPCSCWWAQPQPDSLFSHLACCKSNVP